MTPPLRERLRTFRFTRAGCWADAEFVCLLVGDAFDAATDHVRYAAGWCHRRATAAQGRAASRAARREREAAERADPTPHDLDQWND